MAYQANVDCWPRPALTTVDEWRRSSVSSGPGSGKHVTKYCAFLFVRIGSGNVNNQLSERSIRAWVFKNIDYLVISKIVITN